MTNKKLVIPTILLATILVAGMFAFMPVQKVTTVHTTLGDKTRIIDGAETLNPGVSATVTSALVPAVTGKTFRGTFCLEIEAIDVGGSAAVQVEESSGVFDDIAALTAGDGTCGTWSGLSLRIRVTDDATDDNVNTVVDATIQFTESLTLTTVTTLP